MNKKSNTLPRKVIIGSLLQGFWDKYEGLDKRLELLTGKIDLMARETEKKYPGKSMDLVVLPEAAVTAGLEGKAGDKAQNPDGKIIAAFAQKARQYCTYITIPMITVDKDNSNIYYNSVLILDRKGEIAGTYNKVHPAVKRGEDILEKGVTPGKEFNIIKCDFGNIGIQICFDMVFDKGWNVLADKQVDLVIWPTASPQTAKPRARALNGKYYIVSSTYRNNSSLFEPTGMITAQTREIGSCFVQDIDLSYAILPWSEKLQKGRAFTEEFGDDVGYRYYHEEDTGIFWSNNPEITIADMCKQLNITERDFEIERSLKLFELAVGINK